MATTKSNQLAAIVKGSPLKASQKKWEDETTVYTDAQLIPYLSLGNAVKVVTKENEEIIGKAFKTGQKLVSNQVDNPFEFYARFKGMNYLWYWMMGFEARPRFAYVVKGTWSGTDPMPAVHTDYGSVLFLCAFKGKDHLGVYSDYAVFIDESLVTPASPLPVTALTATGAKTFTPVTATPYVVMHTFELDAYDRAIREFTSIEATAVGAVTATHNRNLYCTILKHMTEYDMKYQNALSRGFTMSSKSDDMVKLASNFLAFKQDRSATPYIPATLSLSPDQIHTQMVPAHFQTTLEIGAIGSPLEELAVSDWTLSVDMPLQQIQTSTTGLHIAEPLLSGKYDIGLKATIARHNSNKWSDLRDLQTPLYGKLRCTYGSLLIEIELKRLTLKTAGADDAEVAQEALDLMVEFSMDDENPFAGAGGVTIPVETQESPIVVRVFNGTTLFNEMLGA